MDEVIRKLNQYKKWMDDAELKSNEDRYYHYYNVIKGYLLCLRDLKLFDEETILHYESMLMVFI